MRTFKSIEEFASQVGKEIGVSDWVVVDQARINQFADATGDHQWIHVDQERAKSELPGKTTIAHGFLTLSLIPWLGNTISKVEGVSRGINYGLNKVRFTSMVPTGSRVRLRHKLLAAEHKAGGTQFTHEYTVEIDGASRPACVAEMLTVVYP